MLRKSTFALFVALAAHAAAQTVVLTPATTHLDLVHGGVLTFNATVTYSTPPGVLAFSATLPAGWSYSASGGVNEPPVKPADLTTGTLSWAYITTPASPATFSFNVNYPASLTGLQPLTTTSITRDTAGSAAVPTTGPTVKLVVPTGAATWNGGTDNWTTAAAWTPGTVPNNGTPANSTYSASISSGTATVGSPIAINDLLLLGGTISGLSTLTIAGSGSDWQAGTFSGLTQVVIAPDAFFATSGASNHDFNQTTITNNGQFIWNGSGNLRSGGGGAFVNAAGATFTDASAGAPARITASGFTGAFTFSNAGNFVKSGSTTTSIDVPFTNTGNILVTAGTVAFTSTFTQTSGALSIASGATASFSNGLNFTSGSLTGSGTVTGNLVNGAASGSPAVISPGSIYGTLNVTGALTLLATSQLIFDLSGTTQGVTYDFLHDAGTTTLGGTLTVNLASSFKSTIQTSDSFTVLTATTVSGAFTNVANGTRLVSSDGSGSFLVSYGTGSAFAANNLVLSNFQFTPVPEPSTWALLTLGVGAVAGAALRRRVRRQD